MKKFSVIAVVVAGLLSGCVSGTYETGSSAGAAPSERAQKPAKVLTLALTKAEQLRLADEMIESMQSYQRSGRLFSNPKSRYVLGIGSLDNKTSNIDSLESFEARIKERILEEFGQRVVINDNLRADGDVDVMQDALKEARGNADYDQSKVIKRGGLQTFTHTLRTVLKDDYVPLNGGKIEVTYELNMRINDAYTGTTMWSKTTYITKVGNRKDLKW